MSTQYQEPTRFMPDWSCCVRVLTRMIPLPRDFQDFLRLLNANEIRYVVVGGC